jgi:hypothetical protein
MSTADEGGGGAVLLCFDGSEPARQAIERAGLVLGGRSAIVLTVWESVGSAILRHAPSGATELGREAREISEDVVEELDSRTAERALATATEGAALAAAAGLMLDRMRPERSPGPPSGTPPPCGVPSWPWRMRRTPR